MLLVTPMCVRAQERFQSGPHKGFTKTKLEHMIVEIDEVLTVPDIGGVVNRAVGEGEGLEHALVEIRGPGQGGKVVGVRTNKQGEFRFGRRRAGLYRFKISMEGFRSVVGTILVDKSAPRRPLTFRMEPGV